MNFEAPISITTTILFAALILPVPAPAQDDTGQSKMPKHAHYKLIDLGTFGGPASYFPNGFDGVLNHRGTAAGWADTSTPDPYAPNCFNPDCFVSHAFRWDNGVMTDLGALPGVNTSAVAWISETGLVAGSSQTGIIDPLTGIPEQDAVLWKDGQLIDLGTLGGSISAAFAVNNRGQVVGAALNAIPDPFSFLATQIRAFLWQNGAMQDLGTLGGPEAWAFLVNDRGQVAGWSLTDWTANPVTNFPTQDPFLWENGKMLDLGTLGGTSGYPTALNSRGQVVGQSNLAGDLTFHPFLWSGGVLTDLGTLGGDTGTANWISDRGDVVGKADLPTSVPKKHDAFLWRDGVMTDLGTVPGDWCSNAYYVNSHGQVVGTSNDQQLCSMFVGQHAYLWEHGGPMIDLNTLIPPGSGLNLTYAIAINDRGEIAGFGVPTGVSPEDYETQGHAYILIPCDANHADTDGCGEAAVGVNVNPASVTVNPSTPTEGRQRVSHQPDGSLTTPRARLAPSYRIRGLAAGPRN